ncbi:FAD-dependent oxidoreductase [Moorella sp. E306M]|uniref:FAD-dependent oxidoreductase n=1 Tax=Moorella sp. E306M TaxID=2572683 RepID=UPI0010FFB37C|nr:FAD-dependent oxidoreductase [Moorella sp. E306M]GEA17898.1 putative electron transfer flavoprotein-quinone oxidoreductase YdiS [Moorella sp. E306M]
MSSAEKFDAIVVGAGPAGSACAYVLAREGKAVLLVERGDAAGAKNVSGGRLYGHALKELGEEFDVTGGVERKVTREEIMVMSGDRSVNLSYQDPSFNREGASHPNSYTVLRATLDGWMASKAEEAGAILACGIRVDDVLEENGRVVGVRAGEDEVYADVVVAADGVNSLLAQKAGLIDEIPPHNVAVGVKEVIALPPNVIKERFRVCEDEGAALLILGCTGGAKGGAFLYTNRESVSLGCVASPEDVARKGKPVHRLLQELKMHPAVYPLIEGGETVEYSAHLVSEAGIRGVPGKLSRTGMLLIGDSAGFVINLGYTIRGMDLAILSGIAAARAVLSEAEPARVGDAYVSELEKLKVLPAMRAVRGYVDLLDIPRLYERYPQMAVELFMRLFAVDGEVPPRLLEVVKGTLRTANLSLWQLLKDVYRGIRI